MSKKGEIKSSKGADIVMEEKELVREYFQTDRLTFGVSELLAGQEGAVDTGHDEADEVFYCAEGHFVCEFPGKDESYELKKGDALLIPEGFPHKLYNVGEEKGRIVFCVAPHP